VLVADGSANGADSDNPEALAFHSFINGKNIDEDLEKRPQGSVSTVLFGHKRQRGNLCRPVYQTQPYTVTRYPRPAQVEKKGKQTLEVAE
jgi:hypothetical protein